MSNIYNLKWSFPKKNDQNGNICKSKWKSKKKLKKEKSFPWLPRYNFES